MRLSDAPGSHRDLKRALTVDTGVVVDALRDVVEGRRAALRGRQGELALFLLVDPPERREQLRAVKIARGVLVVNGALDATADDQRCDYSQPLGLHFPMADNPPLVAEAIHTWHRALVHGQPERQAHRLQK